MGCEGPWGELPDAPLSGWVEPVDADEVLSCVLVESVELVSAVELDASVLVSLPSGAWVVVELVSGVPGSGSGLTQTFFLWT